jgi:hypothetical protein
VLPVPVLAPGLALPAEAPGAVALVAAAEAVVAVAAVAEPAVAVATALDSTVNKRQFVGSLHPLPRLLSGRAKDLGAAWVNCLNVCVGGGHWGDGEGLRWKYISYDVGRFVLWRRCSWTSCCGASVVATVRSCRAVVPSCSRFLRAHGGRPNDRIIFYDHFMIIFLAISVVPCAARCTTLFARALCR